MGGGRVGGNATPAGPGAARGRREGREPIPLSEWCQSAPLGSLDPRTRRTDSTPDRRTRAGAGRRPSSWVRWWGRASRLDAPGPPRAARAGSRLSHQPISARVGRGGESAAAGRSDARRLGPQVTRGPRPALCDQMRSPAEGASQTRDDS